ncbi:gntR transcriptional regulator, partial [Pseudomonas syringae pv. actinidiae str. M302091]
EALRAAIMNGRLEPGERLTQQAIANAFQVSRMPVARSPAFAGDAGLHRDGVSQRLSGHERPGVAPARPPAWLAEVRCRTPYAAGRSRIKSGF